MTLETDVAAHYTSGTLLQRIRDGLSAMGVDPDRPAPEDLKPIDEFHVGGLQATEDLIAQLALGPDMHVLDIGSGLGGTSRFVAGRTGAKVTGIDLTPEFVEIARALSAAVGLADRTDFRTGSATGLPFADAHFDAAIMLHVGMNIPDKNRIMAEAARVLKPGAIFAVFDVMQTGDGAVAYPVPWAEVAEHSFLEPPAAYRDATENAGFTVEAERERRELGIDFFVRARAAVASGLPPIGLHLIQGANARQKRDNMYDNLTGGMIAPVELILRKPE